MLHAQGTACVRLEAESTSVAEENQPRGVVQLKLICVYGRVTAQTGSTSELLGFVLSQERRETRAASCLSWTAVKNHQNSRGKAEGKRRGLGWPSR